MQHAQQQPTLPLRRTILAPVVALVIGVAGAAGVFALVHDDGGVSTGSGVVAIDSSTASTETKSESRIAAAVGSSALDARGETKDESLIAAAIAVPHEPDLSDEAALANRTDPHGPASALR